MTASKPKQVGWCAANGEILSLSGKKQWLRFGGSMGKTAGRFDEPLIRLADHEAAMSGMEPAGSYQKGYDEGRNQGTRHRVADIQQLEAARAADKARIAELEAAIKDPEKVFLNMKRGAIATPSVRLWSKLFGEVLNDDDARLVEIARLRERLAELEDFAREIVNQYPNPNLTHEQFRVHACKHAEAVMARQGKESET